MRRRFRRHTRFACFGWPVSHVGLTKWPVLHGFYAAVERKPIGPSGDAGRSCAHTPSVCVSAYKETYRLCSVIYEGTPRVGCFTSNALYGGCWHHYHSCTVRTNHCESDSNPYESLIASRVCENHPCESGGWSSGVVVVVVVVVVTLKDLPDLHSPVEGHLMRMSSVVTG